MYRYIYSTSHWPAMLYTDVAHVSGIAAAVTPDHKNASFVRVMKV
jgi:hypothetical protein